MMMMTHNPLFCCCCCSWRGSETEIGWSRWSIGRSWMVPLFKGLGQQRVHTYSLESMHIPMYSLTLYSSKACGHIWVYGKGGEEEERVMLCDVVCIILAPSLVRSLLQHTLHTERRGFTGHRPYK